MAVRDISPTLLQAYLSGYSAGEGEKAAANNAALTGYNARTQARQLANQEQRDYLGLEAQGIARADRLAADKFNRDITSKTLGLQESQLGIQKSAEARLQKKLDEEINPARRETEGAALAEMWAGFGDEALGQSVSKLEGIAKTKADLESQLKNAGAQFVPKLGLWTAPKIIPSNPGNPAMMMPAVVGNESQVATANALAAEFKRLADEESRELGKIKRAQQSQEWLLGKTLGSGYTRSEKDGVLIDTVTGKRFSYLQQPAAVYGPPVPPGFTPPLPAMSVSEWVGPQMPAAAPVVEVPVAAAPSFVPRGQDFATYFDGYAAPQLTDRRTDFMRRSMVQPVQSEAAPIIIFNRATGQRIQRVGNQWQPIP